MRHVRTLISDISNNPIARVIFACLLLAASVGGLALASFTDNYVNGGVTWGHDTPPVPLADVNPMGVNLFLEKEVEPEKVVQTLDMARDAGFTWIRQGFAWNDIEISAKGDFTDTRNPGKVVSSWDKYDFIVDQAVAHGMTIMARLDSPPNWARMPGDDLEQFRKGPPDNNSDFGDFAAAVASRYKGKIKYYQIWNEPNLYGEWGGHPVNAEQYVALLKVAHDRIKEVDPGAVIISAALAPTTEDSAANRNDILFLEDMYSDGAAPYFDVMSTMLYGLGQPPDDRRMDFKRLSFSRSVLLHDVMVKNGDVNKPVWISEYAWISYPPDLHQQLNLSPEEWNAFQAKNIWGHSVDEETQGRYLVEGYERARDEWPWMGVMFVWNLRNPDADPLEPATYFSILRQDFTPRSAYYALQDYSKVVPGAPTPQDRPFLNTMGFILFYGVFGLLALASFAYLGTGAAAWAQAALDMPRGRYSPQVRELARNGAAVVGMVGLFLVYYKAESLPLIGVALAGYLAIAVFKPEVALALVAVAIPFFWYPKEYGSLHFPSAETLLLLAFAALVARRSIAFMFPNVWARVTVSPARQNAAIPATDVQVAPTVPAEARQDAKATKPLPVLGNPAPPDLEMTESELQPAHWPARPKKLIGELAKPIAVNWPENNNGRNMIKKRPPLTRTVEIEDHVSHTTYHEQSGFRKWVRQDAFAFPAVVLLVLGAFSLLTLANQQFAPDSARAYRWEIIEPVLFYFLLTDIITTRRALLRVLDFFVAAGVFVSFVGLWQYFGSGNTLDVEGVSRVMGVYEHPNNLALYLDRVSPFAACLALFIPWGWRRVLYGLACLPLFATIFLTYSRGAWGAVVVALVVGVSVGLRWPLGGIFDRVTTFFRRWLVGVAVAGVVAAIAILILFPSLPGRIFSPTSGVKRLDIWRSALLMGRDHPVFGIGLDQFLNQFQAKDPYGQWLYIVPSQENELYTSHPHNIVLDWWLSLGIIGLFVLVWLLWRYCGEAILLARRSAQRGATDPVLRAIVVGLIASMTAFLVHGLVDNSYFLMDLALIFWLSCGVLQLSRMLYQQKHPEKAI